EAHPCRVRDGSISPGGCRRLITRVNQTHGRPTRRFGDDVKPHDLRRTFTGNLLESGADLSVVSKVLGHVSPATTAGYDRRGQVARLAAVEKLHVPLEDFDSRA
ncbi:site-specific integrase, partial [Micrococcus luteus]|uniref:site-specific integrase n=1 Tax=Micrococcus luteus TaxID=1270 RepID=UPI0033F75366